MILCRKITIVYRRLFAKSRFKHVYPQGIPSI